MEMRDKQAWGGRQDTIQKVKNKEPERKKVEGEGTQMKKKEEMEEIAEMKEAHVDTRKGTMEAILARFCERMIKLEKELDD